MPERERDSGPTGPTGDCVAIEGYPAPPDGVASAQAFWCGFLRSLAPELVPKLTLPLPGEVPPVLAEIEAQRAALFAARKESDDWKRLTWRSGLAQELADLAGIWLQAEHPDHWRRRKRASRRPRLRKLLAEAQEILSTPEFQPPAQGDAAASDNAASIHYHSLWRKGWPRRLRPEAAIGRILDWLDARQELTPPRSVTRGTRDWLSNSVFDNARNLLTKAGIEQTTRLAGQLANWLCSVERPEGDYRARARLIDKKSNKSDE